MQELDLVKENLIERCKGVRFAIAVSGGIDSVALASVAKSLELNFISIIIDHNFRDNSSMEAKLASDYLRSKEINTIVLSNLKEIPENNIEKNLRDIRYDLITNYCRKNNIKLVLTGHHLDDNIETFLMRIERGSSIEGLTGIKEFSVINGITFFRPFLKIDKAKLKEYLVSNNIKWFEDATNQNSQFTRNKIRLSLEKVSNYDTLKKRLSGVISSLNRSCDFINKEVKKAEDEIYIDRSTIDKQKFINLHEEVALRILKNKFMNIYEDKNKFRFEKISRLYEFIKNDTGTIELANIKIEVNEKYISFLG